MSEMINLRALRAQKQKDKQPFVEPESEPSASEKGPAVEKEASSAQVAPESAKTPMARKRGAAEKDASAQEQKRRKKTELPLEPSTRSGTPIAWFSGIRHEGDHPFDYATFEHRASVEAAWNYMAKFVMENNHVISAYEGELRARNEMIESLQGQLTVAREATDCEKSSLVQYKKKVKNLQASLTERDDLITSLSAELKAAKEAKAQARKEAESECLDKVQGRFMQIAAALKELRAGPMYRLNLKGQTENNKSLVEDLLGSEPPVLEEELKALEGEMAKYGGATEEFESAFDRLMELVLEKNPKPAGAESSKGRPSESAQDEVIRVDEDEESAEGAKEKGVEEPKDVDP